MTDALLSARANALAFARRGYAVLPLHGINADGRCTCGKHDCESPGKHPHAQLAPCGINSATTDLDKIRSCFATVPLLNFGVATERLFVIDIDPRNDGDNAWLELIRKPKHHDVHTWRVITGGGGEHIIFEQPDPPLRSGELTRGVDLKGAGGYIVGVGSLHTHGRRYTWFPDCSPNEVELAPVPEWLLKQQMRQGERRPDSHWTEMAKGGLPDGSRNVTTLSLLGKLIGAGIPPALALELVQCWNAVRGDPPQKPEQITQQLKRVLRLECKKRRVAS
jgi:hypothetical protein